MTPSVFISYSWDDDTHKEWVRKLAKRLRQDGVDVILDRWATAPGDQLSTFMEKAIRENQFVLIICTPRYKSRSDEREGGVGYEGDIMTAEAMTEQNDRKFIPVLRRGTWNEAAPSWLRGKIYIDLSADPYSEQNYKDLVSTLLRKRETPPPIGRERVTISESNKSDSKQLDKIKQPKIATLVVFLIFCIAVVGYIGFEKFWKNEYAQDAEHLVEEIKKNPDESAVHLEFTITRTVTAKIVVDNLKEVEQTVANIRENPRALLIEKTITQAVSLQQQGKKDEAIEKWRDVVKTEGIDNAQAARAWFSVGYLIQDENPEKGISAYNQAISLNPDYAEAYNNRGVAKDELGQHDEAITDYNDAIRLKSNYAEAYNNRGAAKAELGQHDGAIADYEEAIRLKPDYAEAYYNRGNQKAELGQRDDAIADYNEAIRLKRDYANAYYNRGNAKFLLDRHEEAIADYDEAIRLKRDYAEAYNNRGAAKFLLDRHEEAIADYNDAIRVKPNSADAYYNRGKTKAALGQYDEAIADYDEAIRLKRDYAEAYNNRGVEKVELGLIDEARQDFEKARDLARDAGNDRLADLAEQLLRAFDSQKDE